MYVLKYFYFISSSLSMIVRTVLNGKCENERQHAIVAICSRNNISMY